MAADSATARMRPGEPSNQKVREGRDMVRKIRESASRLKDIAKQDAIEAQVSALKQLVPSPGMMYFLPPDWEAVYLSNPKRFFKVVTALKDMRIVSVFDGKTTYRLGHTTVAARGAMSWPPRDAVLYCYERASRALAADFPKKVAVKDGPLFLMKCTGWGRAFFNKERDIWAVEYLKPSGFLISNGKLEGIDIDSVEPGS